MESFGDEGEQKKESPGPSSIYGLRYGIVLFLLGALIGNALHHIPTMSWTAILGVVDGSKEVTELHLACIVKPL
jgi:hypothetical protein